MITLALSAAFLLLSQEIQSVNNPFDAYVAVQAELPDSSVRQEGDVVADPFAWVSSIRMRETGQIQQYLKLELTYVSRGPRINVDSAFYAGGSEADFEVIDTELDCSSVVIGCKVREILSVRFPFQTATGTWRIQFRNRTSSWRGTVTIPDGVFQRNLKVLRTLK